jgi:hypothetical protein
MPQGLELSTDGTMSGSPGVTGSYRLVVLAEDSDPTEPDSTQKEFTFEVGPAAPEVYFVPQVGYGVHIDGKLAEDFWELNQPIAKAVSGRPSAEASFGLYWNPSDLYLAIQVRDDRIVNDSEEPWNDDGVEVFLDILNDHQKEYNSDDKRLAACVSGGRHTVGLERTDYETAVQRTENGYIIEVHIRMDHLGQRNRPNTAYGFDIAVNDDDDGGPRDGQFVWKGTAQNSTDPSGFGTILLEATEE